MLNLTTATLSLSLSLASPISDSAETGDYFTLTVTLA